MTITEHEARNLHIHEILKIEQFIMAVEKVYQPYDEQVYNSIPKQQPQTKPKEELFEKSGCTIN